MIQNAGQKLKHGCDTHHKRACLSAKKFGKIRDMDKAPSKAALLRWIAENPDQLTKLRPLCDHLGLSHGTFRNVLHRLDKEELITRDKSPRGYFHASITEKGYAALNDYESPRLTPFQERNLRYFAARDDLVIPRSEPCDALELSRDSLKLWATKMRDKGLLNIHKAPKNFVHLELTELGHQFLGDHNE